VAYRLGSDRLGRIELNAFSNSVNDPVTLPAFDALANYLSSQP